jgi:predicted RNA-binding Zn-ribbon protein involved in translation (DUF1610 family)
MEKVQLSFNCRTAGERVLERSTLVNIRVDTVDEAVALYQELKASLGNGAVISEHEYLPQIPNRVPVNMPVVPNRYEPTRLPAPRPAVEVEQPESPGKCPRCGAGLILRTAKKGPRAGGQFWSCGAFYTRGCLFTRPA